MLLHDLNHVGVLSNIDMLGGFYKIELLQFPYTFYLTETSICRHSHSSLYSSCPESWRLTNENRLYPFSIAFRLCFCCEPQPRG